MLANAVLLIHLAVVLFLAAGLPVIYLGAALGWAWVRERHWRLAHLLLAFAVAGESLLGVACPLTLWEDSLRGQRAASGFIERWIHRFMFYDLAPWVFILAYLGFALCVAVTWTTVRPRSRGLSRS